MCHACLCSSSVCVIQIVKESVLRCVASAVLHVAMAVHVTEMKCVCVFCERFLVFLKNSTHSKNHILLCMPLSQCSPLDRQSESKLIANDAR